MNTSKFVKLLRRARCDAIVVERVTEDTSRFYGKFQGVKFVLDLTNDTSILLTVGDHPNWQATMSAVSAVCQRYLKAEPICSYDAYYVAGMQSHFTEWNLENPERYLRTIVNRDDKIQDVPFLDLTLYGGRQLADYVDAELQRFYSEMAIQRRDCAKVYGLDPGKCDILRVKEAGNLGLCIEYTLLLETLSELLEPTARLAFKDLTSYLEEVQQCTLMADYVVYHICQRNQIPVSQPSREHRLRPDADLLQQFVDFYGNYLNAHFPDNTDLLAVVNDYLAGKDISGHEPSADWRRPYATV